MLAGVQQRHDVRVRQTRGELHFSAESIAIDPCGKIRRQHLDDDLSPERVLLRHEDAAHAAAGQFALDRVRVAQGALEVIDQLVSHVPPCRVKWTGASPRGSQP